MIRLVPTAGPRAGHPVELGDGARIGRLPACELVVVHSSVSRVHARIERRGEHWFCVDADSRNGLFVAGERLDEVELIPGLELLLGEFSLRVDDKGAGSERAEGESIATVGDVIEDDFEFDLDAGRDAGGGTAMGRAPAAPASSTDEEGGFEFEDPAEIEVGVGKRAAASAARRTAPAAEHTGLSQAQVRSAQYLAEESQARSGLVRGELTQQPVWVQALTYLGVLLFACALAYGAYAIVG